MAAARRLLLVADTETAGEHRVLQGLPALADDELLWVAVRAPSGIAATTAPRVLQFLGGEFRLLVFNAHQGFHPDAFAAAVGMLRGGGDCVVLAPPLDRWPSYADPDKARFAAYPRSPGDMAHGFLGRLCGIWQADDAVVPVGPDAATGPRAAPPVTPGLALNAAQDAAIAAVMHVAHGHPRRPLVLTADRGRGKSTVLGVAAGRLLAAGLPRITVVAPHRAAAATLFAHARASAGLPPGEVGDITVAAGRLRFRLPQEIVGRRDGTLGLVMVDEAAAIPTAVLTHLLDRSNRLVFASTVHGYEGSGRGFDLRFRAVLQRRMPQWHAMRLEAPVRWAADDPLERLLNRTFLLDAELAAPDRHGDLVIEAVGRDRLGRDEALLQATFSLLVNAHYQTRPSDLRQLLDNPDLELWLARRHDEVLGVALVSVEGGLDGAIAAEIIAGRRRPRGHLLPQSLAVHAGQDALLALRVLRVQRIAVHPALRRRGIGRRLLRAITEHGRRQGSDLLGSAFAAELSLLAFWRASGLDPVRVGVRVDPASAAHSLFVLHGLSGRGLQAAATARRTFLADLPWMLGGSLSTVDSDLACAMLSGRDCSDLPLTDGDRHTLARVAAGIRRPATAEASLWRALVHLAAAADSDRGALVPLVAWQLQHREIDRVCGEFALHGRRALERHLCDVLSRWLEKGPSFG